jgi:hypothetical protein
MKSKSVWFNLIALKLASQKIYLDLAPLLAFALAKDESNKHQNDFIYFHRIGDPRLTRHLDRIRHQTDFIPTVFRTMGASVKARRSTPARKSGRRSGRTKPPLHRHSPFTRSRLGERRASRPIRAKSAEKGRTRGDEEIVQLEDAFKKAIRLAVAVRVSACTEWRWHAQTRFSPKWWQW